jgi:hypothetical protein
MTNLLWLLGCLLLSAGCPLAAASDSLEAWERQYQRAEWVAGVQIESVSSLVNPSLSQNRFVAVVGYRYTASVTRNWKGGQGGTIQFQVNLSDCGQLLEVDHEYIIFGTTSHRGNLRSLNCEDMIRLEESDQLPVVLDTFSQRRQISARLSHHVRGEMLYVATTMRAPTDF